jgi:hypothetical protein
MLADSQTKASTRVLQLHQSVDRNYLGILDTLHGFKFHMSINWKEF